MQNNLDVAIESYVESKRNIWSHVTTRNVLYTLSALAPHFGSPAKSYQNLIKAGKSRYTIKTYFQIAQRFERECFGTANYNEFFKSSRTAFKNCYQDKTKRLTVEQYVEFTALYKEHYPAMFNLLVLMGEAGLRLREALAVKWSDFDNGFLKVVGKGNKMRLVPFNKEKLISNEKEEAVGSIAYRYHFKADMKPFSPHDFRAFYATNVANHPELSIKDAALVLGHADIKTTSRYIRSDLNRIAKVLNR